MTAITRLALLALMPLALCACANTESSPQSAQTDPHEPPLRLEVGERRSNMVVTAAVPGGGELKLYFDTGAPGYLHLKPAAAERLGAAVAGRSTIADMTGRSMPVDRYAIDALLLGGRTFAVGEAIAMPVPEMLPTDLDGVMGREFFTDGTVVMDFANDLLIFDRARRLPAEHGQPFTWTHGHITVPLTYQDTNFDAHFDSGNTASPFAFTGAAAATFGLDALPGESRRVRTATDSFTIRTVELPAPVSVGGHVWQAPMVMYPAPGPVANIGAQAVAEHVVIIDFVDERIGIFVPGAPVVEAFTAR